MSVPIIGQRVFVCMKCSEPIRKSGIGDSLMCMNDQCERFGLLSMVAKDPVLEKEQLEELQKEGGDGPVHGEGN